MEQKVLKTEQKKEIIILKRRMNMRIALCDRDIDCILNIKRLIYKYANFHRLEIIVDDYFSGEALLNQDIKYSMLIIEYHQQNPNGLEIAIQLRNRGFNGSIIFYSKSTDLILSSFLVNPYRFLLKPLKEEELFSTLDSFFSSFGTDHPLWVKDGDDTFCLNTRDIFYIEAANKHCFINLKSEKLLCRKTMSCVSSLLPKNHFSKINRAFIINLNYIKSYNKDFALLFNGEKLHISRNYYSNFIYDYKSFLDPSIL